jgi:hypothetical protein
MSGKAILVLVALLGVVLAAARSVLASDAGNPGLRVIVSGKGTVTKQAEGDHVPEGVLSSLPVEPTLVGRGERVHPLLRFGHTLQAV